MECGDVYTDRERRYEAPRAPNKGELQEKRKRIQELKKTSLEKWKHRWNQHQGRSRKYFTTAQPKAWNAAVIKEDPQPRVPPHAIHEGLTRAQSSIMTQLRTEHIGVREYLYRRRVPEVTNKKCQCGFPCQNVKHKLLYCPEWARGRGDWLRRTRSKDIQVVLNDPDAAERIARWIVREGFLEQFKLSAAVEQLVQERQEERGRGRE